MINVPHVKNFLFFFFNDTATTEIYTLSLHDALPISSTGVSKKVSTPSRNGKVQVGSEPGLYLRSEEHTSELQSRLHLVCRLLLEKKKKFQQCQCTPSQLRDAAEHTSEVQPRCTPVST